MLGKIAEVLIPVAVDKVYSYQIPATLQLSPGDFVEVPLGTRMALGVVITLTKADGAGLKPVKSRLDVPPLQKSMLAFIEWVAAWTLAPRGMVLRMVVRPLALNVPAIIRIGVFRAGPLPRRLTPARVRVLELTGTGLIYAKSELAKLAGCSTGVIDALIDEGTLKASPLPSQSVAPELNPGYIRPTLEPGQANAAIELAARVRAKQFSVSLLEGVTGSGKTEVYFEAIAMALESGQQALILMPEIALTTQFLDRFAARFGNRPAEWHSATSSRRRSLVWGGTATGEIKVVAGARSALFLPFQNLGLIIIDEEHEAAYKQEDGVSYHARDMAVVRGRIEGISVVLASATPSIETKVNAAQGRYDKISLPKRYQGQSLPQLTAIDLRTRQLASGKWISQPLAQAAAETLARGEQALFFLNRRGYAPLTLCRACGHKFQCPHCTAWLVEHRFRRALVCHYCGHIEPIPKICPACGVLDQLMACGPGIERLAEEAEALFPDARRLILSSDLPGGTERMRRELESIAKGECDLIIGTQIVAKGHNFPLLTLVGVIDADIGFSQADPRAAERTFQLLQQVTGRAGRFQIKGQALVQTFQPSHPVIAALISGEPERFYEEEIAIRLRAGLPPFGRLAALIISSNDSHSAETHARALARAAFELNAKTPFDNAESRDQRIELLGPAEAPIAILRGRYRFRLLLKSPRGADMQKFIREMLANAPPERGGVRVAVDIDPQSFL